MYIYKTTNLLNGRIYIGQSQFTPEETPNYYGSGTLLEPALKKHGKTAFKKEILERDITDPLYLAIKEVEYIRAYNACDPNIGYNLINQVWPNYHCETTWYYNPINGQSIRSINHPGEPWVEGRASWTHSKPIGKWWYNTLSGECTRSTNKLEFPWVNAKKLPNYMPKPRKRKMGPHKGSNYIKETVECANPTCDSTFNRPKNSSRPQQFCSKSCGAYAKVKERKTKTCANPVCNNTFEVIKDSRNKTSKQFCSKSCASQQKKSKTLGNKK